MNASGAVLNQTDGYHTAQTGVPLVGDTLRLARTRADISLIDIAAATKIGTEYLEAIESMDRFSLPPKVYALGFVRCYADYLGLNAEEMVRNFKAQFYDELSPLGDLSPRPAPAWIDFRLPRGTGMVLVIACVLGLMTWYGLRTPTPSVAAVPAVPAALADWAKSHDLGPIPALPGTHASLDGS